MSARKKVAKTRRSRTPRSAQAPAVETGPFLFSPTFKFETKAELEAAERAWEAALQQCRPTSPTPIDPRTGLPFPDPVWQYLTPERLHTYLDEIENDLECARDDICESGHGDQGWQEHAMRGLSRLRNAMLSLEDLRSRVEREADEVAK